MTRGPEHPPIPALSSTGGTFPRSSRVRHRREFTRIQSAGARVRSPAFTVVALVQELDRARLGCAISRRVGNAVVRNRIRRLLREVFRRLAASLPAVDFVVIASPPAAELAGRGLAALALELEPMLREAARKAEKRGPRR